MKYLKNFLLFIAFLLGGLLFPFYTNAQALPHLSVDSFSVIEGGAKDLFDIGFTSNNLLPKEDAFLNSQYYFDAWNVGFTSLISFDDDDVTVTELTDQEKEILLGFGNLYDSNGTALTSSDHIYLGNIDNGFFSGTIYIDSTGSILGDNSSLTNRLYNIKYGGYIKNTVEWIQLYDDISADIFDNSYVLPFDSNFDITERSFYLWYGLSLGRNRTEAYIFIPDVYDVGTCVLADYTQGRTPSRIYYNDDANITIKLIRDSRNQYLPTPAYTIENGSWSVGSGSNVATYNHRINITPYTIYSNSDSNINSFNSSNDLGNQKSWNFSETPFTYNTSLLESSNFASFKQLQFEDSSTKVLNFDDTFDYNELKELLNNLNNLQPTINNEFDYSKPITEYNYYNYTYITQGNNLNNSELPLPNGNNSPFPSNDPNLTYDPDIQPSSEQVQLSFDNFNIPFVSGLFNRYPFCIPWDLKNFVTSLKAEPEAPAWDFDYSITVAGQTYTTHFEGDLSDYNSLATIFRNLLLIGFIIGLCKFSYDHHF